MDKEKTLLRLSTQIDTLKAHINRLKKDNYEIHQLDVEMLKKKTIEFYELVFELEAPVVEKEGGEIKNEPEVKVEEVVEEVIEPEVRAEKKVEKVDEKPKAEIEKVVEVEVEKEIIEPVVEKQEPEPESEINETEVPEAEVKQTAYDLFSGSADSAVVEKFHISDEPSIAEKMQKSHIANIREAIGINEKFLFINELFNGDMGRYNKILDDINDLTTKQGVDTYLFELKVQFQWADDNDAYISLKELLDRKFS